MAHLNLRSDLSAFYKIDCDLNLANVRQMSWHAEYQIGSNVRAEYDRDMIATELLRLY